ncbi:hypothetical protein HBI42_053310 [Parastagonospora nodorum]|nr:hypothetical protein HBI79_177030 [Parastagonospora nodorum]KAH5189766.1 hypothetical protein HBH76_094470 [Parastagonospora nodorum]KAH5319952.1 hypothetical protein HBI12_106680 [Parastagonospora nodorum]KAH6227235.1 hypothetical protein HBI43_059900 [Parastagonospora nodorum]KAH6267149.1 hypothetical protein HBI42_053310 [Parastagonospora nodorum]
MDMGHTGTPLSQAVDGTRNAPRYTADRADLVRFLLENGAKPNQRKAPDLNEPGNYLQSAAAYSSLEVTELLIQHGAQIEQSGAMHKAAENGRMDEWTSWNESCVMERMATSNYGQISRIQHATGPG